LKGSKELQKEGETKYSGHSVGLDFLGNAIISTNEQAEIRTFQISKTKLGVFREKFRFLG
jgi:hypothetical protein